jgi:hypothetical protein
MGLIVNYWLIVSDAFKEELADTLGSIHTGTVQATTFPKINEMPAIFKRSLREAPSRGIVNYSVVPGTTVWSGYATADTTGELVPTREFMEELEALYFPDFYVGGMWDFHTGEPIGGVGAPWFVTPLELAPVLGGTVRDVSLNSGQAKRKFV